MAKVTAKTGRRTLFFSVAEAGFEVNISIFDGVRIGLV